MVTISDFEVVSFDCYGTLIDWEGGILGALAPLLHLHGITSGDGEILRVYSQLEAEAESGPFVPYEEVLRRVVRGFAGRFEFGLLPGQENRLIESLPSWKPFPDTVPALRRLKETCRLAIFSNISDALLAETLKHLEVDFDCLITADAVRSYKPAPGHFLLGLEKLGIPKEKLLHVAESRRHDIEPARVLGIASVWVRRKKEGATASGINSGKVEPDWVVEGLGELVG